MQQGQTSPEGGRRVLVVEDDDQLREVVCAALAEGGFRAEGAANGAQALATLLSGQFDALVLDVILPGMNGAAVLDELRRAGRSLPVVLVSAYAGMLEAARLRGLGKGAVLRKPFRLEELVGTVAALLADAGGSGASGKLDRAVAGESDGLRQ